MGNDKTYDRHINIWINGKEVKNDITSITKEMFNLNRQVKDATVGSAEYNQKAAELRKVKSILKEHQDQIKATGGAWDKIKSAANSGMGIITAGIAGVVGAYNAVKGVIFSTDALGDKFEFTLSGWKSGLDAVARSIATMDFKNFGKNIKEAIEEGVRYAEKQDEISDKLRALKFRESEVSSELLKQRSIENSALKTKEARIAAGLKAEKLEDDLAVLRTAIAKERYDTELENAMVITHQSPNIIEAYLRQDEGLMQLLKTGQTYLDLNKKLAEAESGTAEYTTPGAAPVYKYNQALIASLKDQIGALGPMAAEYSQIFNGLGNLVDEKKDKIVNAFAALKEAETSNLANTMKIRTKTDNLLAQEQEALDKETRAQLKALNDLELAKDLADEKRKKKDDIGLFGFNQMQQRSVIQFKEAGDAMADANDEKNKRIHDSNKKLYDDIIASIENEERETKEKYQLYLDFSSQLGQALGQAIAEGTLSARQASKILLENALDTLGKFAEIAIAKATFESLTSPLSVATFGAAGLAKAAILTALIETALAAAKGVINKNMWTGGYTGDGGKYEPAGIVHKGEWVANADLVASPVYGPMIQSLEYAQASGTPGYVNGGGPGINASGSGARGSASALVGSDPEMKAMLRENRMLLRMLLKNGVNMKFGWKEADNVQQGLDKLSGIRDSVSS